MTAIPPIAPGPLPSLGPASAGTAAVVPAQPTIDPATLAALTQVEPPAPTPQGVQQATAPQAVAPQTALPAPTPQVALQAAVRGAATTQGGLANLLADLAAVVRSPAMPAPVQAAAQQVLSQQLPLDPPPSAADLKQAVAQSGLFLEAQLAQPGAQPTASDLKSALLTLSQALQTWSADTAARATTPAAPALPAPAAAASEPPASTPETPAAPTLAAPTPASTPSAPAVSTPASPTSNPPASALPEPNLPAPAAAIAAPALAPPTSAPQAPVPAPPYKGGPVRGQAPAAPSLPPDAPAEAIVARLRQETTAALSRQTLMQAASAPDAPSAQDRATPAAHWLFEIPLATPQGPAIAQFEIDRDGGHAGTQAGADSRVWRARFSLDVTPMGPVHARIALHGGTARVTLWAEDAETAAKLTAQQGELSDGLLADNLEPQVQIVSGAPATPTPPPSGRLMDKAI